MKINKKTRQITNAAIIAAVYVILTYITNAVGLASGAIQCRLSEAMCVLPAFTSAAVPGLFIGCLISNLLCGNVILDIVFGSVATLIGAVGTYVLSKKKAPSLMYPFPAIVANTVIVPFVLKYAYGLGESVWYFVVTVGVGEIISCGFIGLVLYRSLCKYKNILFGK